MNEVWSRVVAVVFRWPLVRSCDRYYREHTAQVRFVVLTTLMVIFVMSLLVAVITVTNLDPKGKHSSGASGIVRTYYIAADEILWDYAPYKMNKVTGQPFTSAERVYTASGPQRIGTTYKKAVFREYTDASFTTLKPTPTLYANNGILGPTLYGETNDKIEVVFKNNASVPLSILAEGLTPDNNISVYMPSSNSSVTTASNVLPGDTFTYTWAVKAGISSSSAPSTSVWIYYSQTDPYNVFAGLVGAVVLTYPGNLVEKIEAESGITYYGLSDINQEIFALVAIFDENLSPYFDTNVATFLGNASEVDKNDPAFQESNRKYSINGYLYGNFPTEWNITANAITRWNVLSLTGAKDIHRPFWPGRMGSLRFTQAAVYYLIDTTTLMPGESKVVDMNANMTGRTLFECQIAQNARAGMITAYSVA